MIERAPDRNDWLMIVLLGFTWGGTFLVIELALEGISPFWLAASRISFAAFITILVWWFTGARLFLTHERNWPLLLLIGFTSTALPFQLISWGQQHVTSAFVGVSMSTVAMITLPLAHFFVPGARMSIRLALSFAIGFLGVLILLGPSAFASEQTGMVWWGQLACIAAAACYAVSSVAIRLLPPVNPVGLAAVPLVIGSGFVIPTAWAVEGPMPYVTQQTLFYLLVLGLIPTAAANLLRIVIIRRAGPVFMNLTNFQVPIWSVVLGAVVLNEPVGWSLTAALGLLLTGLAINQYPALMRAIGRTNQTRDVSESAMRAPDPAQKDAA